jgi:hypothetical protein
MVSMAAMTTMPAVVEQVQQRAEEEQNEGERTEHVRGVFRDQEEARDQQEAAERKSTGAAPPRCVRRFVHSTISQLS